MTRDDIIRMARESGIELYPHPYNFTRNCTLHGLTKLVNAAYEKGAAAEREKVARWNIGSGYTTGHGNTIEDLLNELEWQVRESERNVIADAVSKCDSRATPKGIAAAIRARGQG